jgi:anti-anti-sigma factor
MPDTFASKSAASAVGEPAVRLEVAVVERSAFTLIRLDGELDVYTATALRDRMADHDPARRSLVIDLREVTFVDSAGLGVLVSLRNQARQGGRRVGLMCSASVGELLALTGLLTSFALDVDPAPPCGRLGGEGARPAVRA